MDDCIFCKIIKGELPSTKLYETDKILVFKDIHPRAPIHLLIVPKEHIKDFYDVKDNSIYIEMMDAVKKMIDQFNLMGKGYRLLVNGGGAQIINHLHFQLLGEIGLNVQD